MRFYQMLQNHVVIKFMCADPSDIISQIADYGIILRDLKFLDDITAVITVDCGDEGRLLDYFTSKGVSCSIEARKGVVWSIRNILKRPVLLCAFLLFLTVTMTLPNRILFVCVEGNETVSAESILSSAETAGVYFGASRKNIRSEKIKNFLLETIPQLQWAGVNTHGCVAVISVREGNKTDNPDETTGIYSVVASRDGVIRQMTVYSGNPVCTVGQSVRKGQVLVSGYTDCGILIRTESANAEIYGDTKREISAKTPSEWIERPALKNGDTKFSIVFGKKRINLFKDTGILDTTCVKMYKQYYVVLPGNFIMPFSIIATDEYLYETETSNSNEAGDFEWMGSVVESCLSRQMLSGTILERNVKLSYENNAFIYYGAYACREMIGKMHSEEIYTSDGKTS